MDLSSTTIAMVERQWFTFVSQNTEDRIHQSALAIQSISFDNLQLLKSSGSRTSQSGWDDSSEPRLLMMGQGPCKTNARDVFTNDVQRLFDSTQKIVSPQQTNHDMVSHRAKARVAAKELKGLFMCNSIEETTK
ncbi:hypothetical protein CR513_19026, partial [Mucuna pruriens]